MKVIIHAKLLFVLTCIVRKKVAIKQNWLDKLINIQIIEVDNSIFIIDIKQKLLVLIQILTKTCTP